MTIVKAKNTETQISDTQNLENENQLNSEAIQTNYYKYIKSKFNDFFFFNTQKWQNPKSILYSTNIKPRKNYTYIKKNAPRSKILVKARKQRNYIEINKQNEQADH